jgi:DNA-binding LacI/PurR family transcriptional regulator
VGLIIAARELGIQIPTELSVIGIDGHPYAEMFRLTTIEQHPRNQATMAIDSLLAQLDQPGGPAGAGRVTRVPTNLVMRSSTSAPR